MAKCQMCGAKTSGTLCDRCKERVARAKAVFDKARKEMEEEK